jgi:hypothetical protein
MILPVLCRLPHSLDRLRFLQIAKTSLIFLFPAIPDKNRRTLLQELRHCRLSAAHLLFNEMAGRSADAAPRPVL